MLFPSHHVFFSFFANYFHHHCDLSFALHSTVVNVNANKIIVEDVPVRFCERSFSKIESSVGAVDLDRHSRAATLRVP